MENKSTKHGAFVAQPKLSICIATYNRAKFIGETLDSILNQMQPGVELVIVDGASPDNTQVVMRQYSLHYPEIHYHRESVNSGVDGDYDKAVGYSTGKYCWLMTDDDLLALGSIARVLDLIETDPDLVVINSKIKNADLSLTLEEKILKFSDDRNYATENVEVFFSEVANYLSFIGGVVIKRNIWMQRDRSSYYGTLFIHVGVIFQHPPIKKVKVISDPLITIRYGNAMWEGRGFEIWMFKWPQLIWSFPDFSDQSKLLVVAREPWRNLKLQIFYRAIGGYSISEYHNYIKNKTAGFFRFTSLAIALFPASVANLLIGIYCVFFKKKERRILYDISRSRHANIICKSLKNFF